jgi:fructokinase
MQQSGSVICLGETLVDFVCEQPVERLVDARAFRPFFGGSQGNVAVGVARFGARSLLVGGAGDDPWGRWLRDTLVAEGVDVSRFALVPGAQTPHAFVAVSDDGEPSFSFYGDGAIGVAVGAEDLDPVMEERGVFVFGSDTLIREPERKLTLRARDRALERGWDVVFDPNLRAPRWVSETEMLETALSMVGGSTVVKANLEEARALTGRSDALDAAATLLELGTSTAVITLGADGIIVACGDADIAHVPAVASCIEDATGAGDAVSAVLAAALAHGARREQLVDVVGLATRIAAQVVEVRGALAGLPSAAEAGALLRRALRG